MNYLEKISPSYFDILSPLRKWKILSIKSLKEEAGHIGTRSGFYKIVSKLEQNLLIDSFINAWSNEKFVYLGPKGLKALGIEKSALHINRDLRFHDSLVTKVARYFEKLSVINEVFLDFEVRESFPLLERVPDCLVTGQLHGPFHMAIEVELTQKSKERMREIFRTYSDSKVVNQVLYIMDKKSIRDAYLRILDELGSEINQNKFLFLYAPNLSKQKEELINESVIFKNQQTTLKELFRMNG